MPPELMLQKLEAAGASPKDLAEALMDAFHVSFPEFRGLSSGFRRREQLSAQDPQMGIWALTIFRDGWRVLDHLGTTPEGLLCYLLGRWRPGSWLEEADLLRVPAKLRELIEPNRLVFGPQDSPLDPFGGWVGAWPAA